ncbi:MAG: Flp pilus assembly protein CpaB [Pseudomonadota bacterium]|nr:Flp pilus assembly protein CpaB [Pseudomonadota bacterium]
MINKRNSIVFLALALVLGLGAAFLAQKWARQNMSNAEQHATRDVVPVVVATREIGFGERIEEGFVRSVDWPAHALPPGAFDDPAKVVGQVSKYQILTGEPILAARVADPKTSPLLASLIEPNKRAVTVRVDDVVGVGGFLLPGSRVDVVASRQLERQQYETSTILHNLRVLAVDQIATAGGEDKPVVVRAVTLETDPHEAEALLQATNEGTVQLALRNPTDHALPAVAAVKPPLAPRPAVKGVTVIRGTHVDAEKSGR